MSNDTTLKALGITALALVLSSIGACGGATGSASGDGSNGDGAGDSGSANSGSGGSGSQSDGDSDGTSSGDGDGTSSGDGDGTSSDGAADGTSSGSGGSGDGSSSSGSGSGTSGGTITVTPIKGGGSNSSPLGTGCGPETASECHPVGGDCSGAAFEEHEVKNAGAVCFFGEGIETPSATVEHVTEVVDGQEYVHLRVTLDPDFVDTTYGECSPQTGWPQRRGHTFADLLKSDHIELILYNCAGDLSMQFKVDFIETDDSAPCGYSSAGVMGGDGSMAIGDPADILEVTTSLDRNMNGCGYCDDMNSPCTDSSYAEDPDAPEWDFRLVYELWIDPAAFGGDGFCNVDIDYVHASPAKGDDETILVEPDDCGSGGSGGTGGTTSTTGSGGSGGSGGAGGTTSTTGGSECPPDYELILTSEGEYYCDGPPGDNGECPEGYVIDLTSEGERCISEEPVM